jgi:hypothetical protein
MAILEPYVPREYLALQINYCKQQLAMLPEVKMTFHMKRGENIRLFICNNHTIKADTQKGKELERIYEQREELSRKLSRLEGLWHSEFRGLPPSYIAPRKIQRRLYISSTESVILDSEFFDSLKNDANPEHRESKTSFYNGIFYRSAAEADIARYYTETDTPFKYEPEIWLKGLNRPIHPDFVTLVRELDLCKIHEHFGMKNAADYNRITAVKYNNYSGAGLIPGLDTYFTYDVPGIPFDLRCVPIKLNSVVYSSLFLPE